MLLRENELGWRLFKSKHGFTIRRTHPPLSSRLWLVGPVFVNLLLAAALWLGRDRALWYTLSALLPLLLWVWWAGSNKAKHIAWATLPGLVMLLGLLTKEAMSDKAVARSRRRAILGFALIVIGIAGSAYVPYRLESMYGEPLRQAALTASSYK